MPSSFLDLPIFLPSNSYVVLALVVYSYFRGRVGTSGPRLLVTESTGDVGRVEGEETPFFRTVRSFKILVQDIPTISPFRIIAVHGSENWRIGVARVLLVLVLLVRYEYCTRGYEERVLSTSTVPLPHADLALFG